MRFPTALSKAALLLAALAGASAAAAEPIRILSAGTSLRPAAPASDCAAASAGAGADIECVLSLTPPPRGTERALPSRILIRAQWAPKPCTPHGAQVVELGRPQVRAKGLPTVDQAGSGRACAS